MKFYTGFGRKPWRLLSYNKVKSILSFCLNLLLKLSLAQSILITMFTSWIWCLWGDVSCQHFPASGGLLTKAWRNRSMFSGILNEGSFPGVFLFAADAASLKFLTHNSTVLRLGTLSFRWILKCWRVIRWVTTTESLFLKYVSTVKARCCTDQRSMETEMLWVSLEGRSRRNSPRQRFHLQLCCKIVRYFCYTCIWVFFENLFQVCL
jgi:hypothetical protein